MSKKSLKRCLLVGSSFLSICSAEVLHAANTQQSAKASERVDENINDKPATAENANRYSNLHEKLNNMQSQLDLISGYLNSGEASVAQGEAREGRYVADAKSSSRDMSKSNKMAKEKPMRDLNSTFCHTNGGLGVSAELLWWSTNYNFPYMFTANVIETNPVGIAPFVTSEDTTVNNGKIIRTNNHWSPGVRLALAYFADYDNIDVALLWTYYHNKTTGHVSGPDDLIFEIFDSAKGVMSLNYNAADFELGKSYFAESKVLLRPFAGVRAVWLDQHHHIALRGTANGLVGGTAAPTPASVSIPASLFAGQDVWAVGPRIGLNTSWFKWGGLSVLGNVSTSLLYGKADQRYQLNLTLANVQNQQGIDQLTVENIRATVRDDYWQLFPTLQLMLGASWERCISKKTSIKLYAGWETNFLWETQNILYFERAISMQGFTGGMSVNF